MSELWVGEYKIDEKCQKMLLALYENDQMETGGLTDVIETDNNYNVTRRSKEFLEPAGLVERAFMKTPASRPNETTIHQITEAGREFVEQNRDDIEKPKSTDELAEQFLNLQANCDDLAESLESVHSQLAEIQGKEGQVEKLITKIQETVGDLESFQEEVDQLQAERKRAEEAAETAEVKVQGIEERLSQMEAEIEDMGSSVEEMDTRITQVYNDVEVVETRLVEEVGELEDEMWLDDSSEPSRTRFETIEERLDAIEERLGMIENAQDWRFRGSLQRVVNINHERHEETDDWKETMERKLNKEKMDLIWEMALVQKEVKEFKEEQSSGMLPFTSRG
jgi:chromosome segregation ATPase